MTRSTVIWDKKLLSLFCGLEILQYAVCSPATRVSFQKKILIIIPHVERKWILLILYLIYKIIFRKEFIEIKYSDFPRERVI